MQIVFFLCFFIYAVIRSVCLHFIYVIILCCGLCGEPLLHCNVYNVVCEFKRARCELQNEYQHVVLSWLDCVCYVHREVTVIKVDSHHSLFDDVLIFVW